MFEELALIFIGDADFNVVIAVQHVELREAEAGEAIEPGRLPYHYRIEPAAAAGATRRGPVLGANGAHTVTYLIVKLGGEGAHANARGIGFRHPEDVIDARWRYTKARADGTDRGIRRGHKGIGAMVDVQHGTLGSFKQEVIPPQQGVAQHALGVCQIATQLVTPFKAPRQQHIEVKTCMAIDSLDDGILLG